jgi:hypothetical protein
VTPIFTINFRREVFLREKARSRARLLALGGWLLYFGLLGLVVGLYALNGMSLMRRVGQVQRQTERLQKAQGTTQDWTVDQAQLTAVETFKLNPRRWRDRLLRLSAILPTNVALKSISVNPGNLSTPSDRNKLVLSGQLRPTTGQDPTRGVVQLVSSLQHDETFSSGYQTIRLTESKVISGSPPTAEFVIESR